MNGLPSFAEVIAKRKQRENAEAQSEAAKSKAIEEAKFKQEVKELARGKSKQKKKEPTLKERVVNYTTSKLKD